MCLTLSFFNTRECCTFVCRQKNFSSFLDSAAAQQLGLQRGRRQRDPGGQGQGQEEEGQVQQEEEQVRRRGQQEGVHPLGKAQAREFDRKKTFLKHNKPSKNLFCLFIGHSGPANC